MVNPIRNSILRVVTYFDIFSYPVSVQEILRFSDTKTSAEELTNEVQTLCSLGCLYKFGEYYCLHDNSELIRNRLFGFERAEKLLVTARKISRFLFWFPFVKAICISGSLSKHVADEKADIDYFIITEANKLWLARTIMHCWKKLSFITGHQHFFCMNYYIDECSLIIEEKNIFTATELVTLLPVCGNGAIDKFFGVNDWAYKYFPNQLPGAVDAIEKERDSRLKKVLESLFRNRLGNRLDNYFMKLTTSRWKEKEEQKKLNYRGERMGLRTDKHFSKPNPYFFQKKILQAFENRYNEWKERWEAIEKNNLQSRFLSEMIK
jgi:hypothetical protein